MSGLVETEVRDGFMQTGMPKMLCCKHGGSRRKVVSLAFLWMKFQDLPITFGQVWKAKNFNQCCIFPVGLGGQTLIKDSMKWKSGVFPCHGITQNSFWA